MASREDLVIIRNARAGNANAQLALGRRYLFGGASLPHNPKSALHWLSRAAAKGVDEAWRLVGGYVPAEVACDVRGLAIPLFGKATEAGIPRAPLVLAELLLMDPVDEHPTLRLVALAALQSHGSTKAHFLLQQLLGQLAKPRDVAKLPGASSASSSGGVVASVEEARCQRMEKYWCQGRTEEYLRIALPQARNALRLIKAAGGAAPVTARQATLLSRCARAMTGDGSDGADRWETREFWRTAANGGDREAQFAFGLCLACMNVDGDPIRSSGMIPSYKPALRWLEKAGEQGVAAAWYVMSRIYGNSGCSMRNTDEAQSCLQRAARMGHEVAQFKWGVRAWRMRGTDDAGDVIAVEWLQKAAAQGNREAVAMLERIAPELPLGLWAQQLLPRLTEDLCCEQPLLVARIKLAALFGLTRPEALLLDVQAADQGSVLVVDIRAKHGRSKRRLLLVNDANRRMSLDSLVRQFERFDERWEGNYRQRLYRLKSCIPMVDTRPVAETLSIAVMPDSAKKPLRSSAVENPVDRCYL